MELLNEYLTDDVVKTIIGWFSTACVVLLTIGKGLRWAFRDKTTNEQRQLFDALLRRLENGSLEWKVNINSDCLEVVDADNHFIQGHGKHGNCIWLGKEDVSKMLTRRQLKAIHKTANAKRQQLTNDKHYDTITTMIREARRTV